MNNRDQHGSRAEGGRLRTGGGLALWPRLLGGLLLVTELSCCRLSAQTNAAKAAPSSRRWLLVVETSKSMQRRADGVLGAVRGMLASEFNSQLQAGDTLGMWTFNEDLYAGRLPLQTWSPQAQEEIMQRTVTFLKAQKYEKQSRFDKVAPALTRVIKDSELITVILISSGDAKVQGTAIDGGINAYYDQWRKQQQKARIPFVMVLRAISGQVTDYSFNTAPWPVQLPRLVAETRSAETARERVLAAASETQPPAVPPQVVSEKEPQLEPAPTVKPEPEVAKAETPPAVDAAALTNETIKAKPPEPTAPLEEVAKAEPPPTTVVAITPNEPIKAKPLEPAPPPVEAVKAEPPPTVGVATNTVEPAKAKPPEPAPPPAEVVKAEPPPTVGVATPTEEPAKAKPPEPTQPLVEVAKAEPSPPVPSVTATEAAPKPATAPTPAAQPKEEMPIAPEAKQVEPPLTKPEAATPPPAPTPKPEPVTIEPPKPSAAPPVTPVPTPAALPAHEDVPAATVIAAPSQPTASVTSSVAPGPSSHPAFPVENAAAVPAEALASHLNIWIAGLVLAVLGAVSAFLLMRRSHATPQGSLITRSFEREKKP